MISHLLPLVLYVLLFSIKVTHSALRVVLLYCLYSFFNDLLLIYAEGRPESGKLGLILWCVFTLVEYCLLAMALRFILKSTSLKKVISISLPIFIFFATTAFYLSFSSGDKIDSTIIDSLSITVEYLLLIAFCLFYFYEEMSFPNTAFIYSSFRFWIVVGILIYSTGTFFFFMYSSSLDGDEWSAWSVINYVFTLLKNTLFSIAVWVAKKESRKSDDYKLNFNDSVEIFKTPMT